MSVNGRCLKKLFDFHVFSSFEATQKLSVCSANQRVLQFSNIKAAIFSNSGVLRFATPISTNGYSVSRSYATRAATVSTVSAGRRSAIPGSPQVSQRSTGIRVTDQTRTTKPESKADLSQKPTRTAWDTVHEMRAKSREKTHQEQGSQENPEAAAATEKPVGRRADRFSDGTKDYRHYMPEWDRMTAADVVNMLKKRIIYDEHDIVAINKPYGLSVHGGPSIHHSVGKYLPELAASLDKTGRLETLFMVNRIDKETTGVLLLARTKESAARLNDMFVKRAVKKYYWAVTKNVPTPLKGVIDIPIGESDATGVFRLVLRPIRTPESALVMNRSFNLSKKQAVTPYSVLATSGDCALIELNPSTGVRHQVRVHLSHGLNCPVLGDHKYSHFTKLAPQRLPPSILKSLKIRQTKVRTLPMHLHARAIVLPEFDGAANIRISAELPAFFRHTLSSLNLKQGLFN